MGEWKCWTNDTYYEMVANMKVKKIKKALEISQAYISNCFLYMIIRRLIGGHFTDIGLVLLNITVFTGVISIMLRFIYFVIVKPGKLQYPKDQMLYIILAISITCLLIELFMFE